MEVTLGGDRLGSGNKQKQELHNYNRATFNQEQDWKSSMAPGVLYPFLCIPMTNGDSMDIDLDAFVRTLPTKGPLFGSFKLQADIFSVPMRLYNGILHNNPIDIGLKMKDIYFPKLTLEYSSAALRVAGNKNRYTWQVHPTSLLKYLGLSGIGMPYQNTAIKRNINAVPILGYYDIFKNYYANKQEEYAYVISPREITNESKVTKIEIAYGEYNAGADIPIGRYDFSRWTCHVYGKNFETDGSNVEIDLSPRDEEGERWSNTLEEAQLNGLIQNLYATEEEIIFNLTDTACELYQYFNITDGNAGDSIAADIGLTRFALKNIDDIRNELLSFAQLGEEYTMGQNGIWFEDSGTDGSGLPYSTLFKTVKIDGTEYYTNYNSFPMNGLCIKTYQSDIYNNWIQTDWIEGENGIAALSAVSVSDGSFQIDALNIAQKVYNMLNRIAISGGTYEDWQEAVYTQEAVRKAETPIYEGGMSGEIMFEEVIATTEANEGKEVQALGQLGGKGTLLGTKGGKNIHIKAREPIFVMGIVSITPRICYTQGNEWYLTELNSYDDLHKPALDQIGFQDLILEQMAWWDTKYQAVVPGQEFPKYHRKSAGKIVAWSNYMTAVDKAFGDFAMPEGKNFMVLSRNYTYDNYHEVQDVTTYIDPAKFNYAFAYSKLDAQNFWVQLHSKVITRRVMSAHQIPNL